MWHNLAIFLCLFLSTLCSAHTEYNYYLHISDMSSQGSNSTDGTPLQCTVTMITHLSIEVAKPPYNLY